MHKSVHAKKRFGQNFLHDDYIISKIISNVKLEEEQGLIEIGPGRGALTESLLLKTNNLHVIEIDRDLVNYLSNRFAKNLSDNSLVIHSKDVLKFDFQQFFNNIDYKKESLFIVGNLPYNISTELLFYISHISQVKHMLFMLQKEVVDRICAEVASTNYSRLSVGLQHKYYCEKLFDVPKESFNPVPQVESAIIRLQRKAEIFPVDEKLFNKVVTAAFNQRRKCIRNSLSNLLDFTPANTEIADKISQYASMRPQELSVADFVNITNVIAGIA